LNWRMWSTSGNTGSSASRPSPVTRRKVRMRRDFPLLPADQVYLEAGGFDCPGWRGRAGKGTGEGGPKGLKVIPAGPGSAFR
jgi:hypothetical protein